MISDSAGCGILSKYVRKVENITPTIRCNIEGETGGSTLDDIEIYDIKVTFSFRFQYMLSFNQNNVLNFLSPPTLSWIVLQELNIEALRIIVQQWFGKLLLLTQQTVNRLFLKNRNLFTGHKNYCRHDICT